MEKIITDLKKYSKDLLFISESEAPFVTSFFETKAGFEDFIKASGKIKVEIQELDYFFRNMTRLRPEYSQEEIANAKKFSTLVKIIKENLKNTKVYRLGEIRVTACIVGETELGNFAVLSTTLIET